jgi:cyclopropane fatty-acyl-phospholipid synthase-like methyltransferase
MTTSIGVKKSKKYWDKQPCNSKNSKKKISKEYFNEITNNRFFVEKHILNFANFTKYKKKRVLEIGCGIGTDAIEFIKNGAQYFGVDFSEKSLELTKKRIKIFNLNKFNPQLFNLDAHNLTKIKKLNVKFDLIYSFGTLHHCKNMKKCFTEIYKLANKKTEIKIMLYAKNSYKNFLTKVTRYRYEAQKGCPIVHKIDYNDLKELINNKFKIKKIEQDFIFPYKIDLYKKNIKEKINYFSIMPKKIFNTLQKNIGEHMLIHLVKK